MIQLRFSHCEAEALLNEVEHPTFRKGKQKYWTLSDAGYARAQSVLWFFCWAKTGMNKVQVKEAISKLIEIRTNKEKHEALYETLMRPGETPKARTIYIGVSFGLLDIKTYWSPSTVDFIARIKARKRWELAHFGNKLDIALKIKEGDTGLPQIYKVRNEANSLFAEN